MVQLQSPLDRQRHENEIISDLRRQFDDQVTQFPGLTYTIDQVEEGPPGGADVAVRFTGKDLPQLGMVARQVADQLKDVPGTIDVKVDYRDENPEIIVEPDPAVVGLYDFTETQLSQAVQTAIHGDTSIKLNLGDDDVTLRLQAADEYQRSQGDLKRLMLTSPTGKRATVGELASLRRSTGLYAVNRYNHSRATVTKCDVTKATTKPNDVFAVLRANIFTTTGFRTGSGQSNGIPGQGRLGSRRDSCNLYWRKRRTTKEFSLPIVLHDHCSVFDLFHPGPAVQKLSTNGARVNDRATEFHRSGGWNVGLQLSIQSCIFHWTRRIDRRRRE